MKKMIVLAAASLSLPLFGCATGTTPPGDGDPELVCIDRTVTVFQSSGFLAVYPEYIHVCAGRAISVQTVPRATGAVEVSADSGDPAVDRWLRGRGERGSTIRIMVPEGEKEAVYKYNVTVEGVGTLDPRVSVVRR